MLIPRHIFVDDIIGNPLVRDRNGHGTRGRSFIHLHRAVCNALLFEPPENFPAIIVIADSGDDAGVGAQRVGVIGKVGGRPAKLRSGGQQIPKHFANSYDFKIHCGLVFKC